MLRNPIVLNFGVHLGINHVRQLRQQPSVASGRQVARLCDIIEPLAVEAERLVEILEGNLGASWLVPRPLFMRRSSVVWRVRNVTEGTPACRRRHGHDGDPGPDDPIELKNENGRYPQTTGFPTADGYGKVVRTEKH